MNFATYNEIKTQTTAWQQALEQVVAKADDIRNLSGRYGQVIFTGCGSTYYLSLAASALYQQVTGKVARAVPGGELLLNSKAYLPEKEKCLLIATSRSGKTTETLRAVEKFKTDQRGEVIVITNYPEGLSAFGDITILIPEGQEESVAQTRSFASMYVAASALSMIAADRQDLLSELNQLPGAGKRIIEKFESVAFEVGGDLTKDRIYFLGSGILYGLACEANLKLKEMSLTHSEPFPFLEFRHGPMSMVNENTLIVGLVSEINAVHERKVLSEMEEKGASVLELSEDGGKISLHSGLSEVTRAILYLPVLQYLAYSRALARGINPDRPHNLSSVIQLDLGH